MKTVLQELIENLESNIKGCEIALIDTIDKEFVKGTKRALEDVKIDISKYLEKEKEQSIEFAMFMYEAVSQKNGIPNNLIQSSKRVFESQFDKRFNQNK